MTERSTLGAASALALGLFCMVLAVGRYPDTHGAAAFSLFSLAFFWSAWRVGGPCRLDFSLGRLLLLALVAVAVCYMAAAIHVKNRRLQALDTARAHSASTNVDNERRAPLVRHLLGDQLLFSIYLQDTLPPEAVSEFLAAFPEAYVSTWGLRYPYRLIQEPQLTADELRP